MDCVLFRTIANYIMWRLVDSTYLRLGKEFEEIFKNFYIQLEDYWVPIPRDELCLQLMKEKYFDTPLSRIYVDTLFNGGSKKIVRVLLFHCYLLCYPPQRWLTLNPVVSRLARKGNECKKNSIVDVFKRKMA